MGQFTTQHRSIPFDEMLPIGLHCKNLLKNATEISFAECLITERSPLNRYRDFNTYLRDIFRERVQKISLDAGLGCPNRDGTISNKGCIFCDDRGSGTGAMIHRHISIDNQITEAKEFLQKRYGAKKFIAYFQSFSNTYGPLPKLKELYEQAISHKNIVGLSIATRPDCVDSDVLDLLSSYNNDYLVWIEYGLQSAHDSTLQKINRGHDIAAFEKGVLMAYERGLNICAHIILGLPGEDRRMMLETARFLGSLPLQGVKIHLLYVTKGTSLASFYQKGEFHCLERPEYVELVVDVLELLPPEMIVQRLTGDPLHSELMAPDWAKEKSKNIGLIREALERRDTWQGRRYGRSSAG